MKGRCRRCGSSVHLRTTYYYYEYEYVLKIPLKVHTRYMAGHATEIKNSINKNFSMQPPAGALAPGSIPVGVIPSELLTHILCHLDVIFFLLTIFFAWKQVQFLFGLLHLCWSLFGGYLPAHVICSRFGHTGRCPTFALHLGL